jgi:hypothetical protein
MSLMASVIVNATQAIAMGLLIWPIAQWTALLLAAGILILASAIRVAKEVYCGTWSTQLL